MLAQTFYVDHGEGARDERLYLGDLLAQHETWASQQFWERSTASAVLDAVDASRLEGRPPRRPPVLAGRAHAARRVAFVRARAARGVLRVDEGPARRSRRSGGTRSGPVPFTSSPRRTCGVLLREYDEPAEEVIV